VGVDDPLVAVALGSNLGDRAAHLDHAVARLRDLLAGLLVSPYDETAPVGVTHPQGDFLNAAAVGRCSLTPHALLAALRAVEASRGRERPFPNAARTLDLDLVLFGSQVIDEPGLTLPHPRFRERRFVLEPLAAIAPDMVDPVTGRTVRELLAQVTSPPRD
jgi:2-amino-4-hydroxy-6-hydroxymethyldihydropteridine diphosphokinase